MKTVVLILALLWTPLVIAGTIAAMIYAMRDRATRPQGLKGFAIVGAVIVAATILIPLLILMRAF